ncbi:hypothetical protein GCM10029992_52940 [Glycomyces albus]
MRSSNAPTNKVPMPHRRNRVDGELVQTARIGEGKEVDPADGDRGSGRHADRKIVDPADCRPVQLAGHGFEV